MKARCRIIFCRLVLQAAAQETAHFAACISFGVGKSVTPLTKLKGIIKNLLNKGVIGIKYFLKAMCRREERKRGLVENGVLRGKVRAFFNRHGEAAGRAAPFRSVQQILSARQGAQNT